MKLVENLYTSGNEFVTQDNKNYIGYYHYHEDSDTYMTHKTHDLNVYHEILFKISTGEKTTLVNKNDVQLDIKLQSDNDNINDENIIDDEIFELLEESDLDKMFRLYDKLKDSNGIPNGILRRNIRDGVVISNDADYKTHAYLVANSKNYMDGDSYMYSAIECGILVSQIDTYRTRVKELETELESLVSTIESLSNTLDAISTNLPNFSDANPNGYIPAFSSFILQSLSSRFLLDKAIMKKYLSELNPGFPQGYPLPAQEISSVFSFDVPPSIVEDKKPGEGNKTGPAKRP